MCNEHKMASIDSNKSTARKEKKDEHLTVFNKAFYDAFN